MLWYSPASTILRRIVKSMMKQECKHENFNLSGQFDNLYSNCNKMKRNLLSSDFNCLARVFFEKILFQGKLGISGTNVDESLAWSVVCTRRGLLGGLAASARCALPLRLQLRLCTISLGEMGSHLGI